MKINIEFDDNHAIYEILDAAFLQMLKRELQSTIEILNDDGYKHPDDVAEMQRNVSAFKVLIEYYGGSYEDRSE